MKKLIFTILILCLIFSAAGCGNDQSESSSLAINIESSSAPGESTETVKTANLVIPKYVVDLVGVNISSRAKALGIEDIVTEDDGSVSYTMTPEQKKEIVSDMKASLLSYIDTMPGDWPFIKKIEINDSFDHITIVADRESYNSTTARTVGAAAYIPVITYRTFAEMDGGKPEEFILGFSVIDQNDYSAVDEFIYPEEESGKTTSTVSGDEKVSGTEYADDDESAESGESTGSSEDTE